MPDTCLASRTLRTLKKQTNLFPISFITQVMIMEFKEWVHYIYGPKDTSEEQNTDITNGGDLDLLKVNILYATLVFVPCIF